MAGNWEGFYFDYDVDSDGSLSRAISADGTARKNYSLFGDAVSFNPTYSTNKYSLVFTAFTGVDHHQRSVTFCGALIVKEDYESFNWVFSHFLIAMLGKEPDYIITDQHPGIIKYVRLVFKTARHQFCMWNILNKVPSKFGVMRDDYHDFMRLLNDIMWDDDLEAEEFDGQWNSMVQKHGISDNDLFADTYDIRKHWVMAHCRDLKMGFVMRTTQRSESENSFFKRFEHKSGMLVEFWMNFESAMDQQRHTQKRLDNDNKHSSPKTSTPLDLEKFGAKVYTHTAFKTFQKEVLYSIDTCKAGGFEERGELEVTIVKHAQRGTNYDVNFNRG
ncbi:protein FAR1-RELATED SEQUENCE 5-like [Silene latifolia]|uniref:protein FAR1-RELATED SEQUENCE 5-like n=1 Tax=Silene latifolia TaxID=37657 RepID=UPI003D78999D